MDRDLLFLATLLLSLSGLLLAAGCKSADDGPRAMVMPASPTMNVPSAYSTAGRPNLSQSLVPASSTDKVFSTRKTRSGGLHLPKLRRGSAN